MRIGMKNTATACGISLFLWGCAFFPPLPPTGAFCRINSEEVVESSGLIASRTYPGIMWTHNDSGDSSRIFAISSSCEVIEEFSVTGATQRDWEDITVDDDNNLYVGDMGNNLNRRKDLVVYRIPEPDPYGGAREVLADRTLPFRYANQKGFLPWNFDAEALFWMDGAPHILTKHRSDRRTQLYRLPVTPAPDQAVLEPIATFDLGESPRFFFSAFGNVTGADLHSDGRLLAILTYQAIFLFERSEISAPFRQALEIKLNARRTHLAESITWDGDDLIFGNEQGYLFRIFDVSN